MSTADLVTYLAQACRWAFIIYAGLGLSALICGYALLALSGAGESGSVEEEA